MERIFLASFKVLVLLMISGWYGCRFDGATSEEKRTMASTENELDAFQENADSVEVHVDEKIPITYLLGKFEPAEDAQFIQLSAPLAGGSADGAYLLKEVFDAFVKMREAAELDSIELVILSATRNFTYQKRIWEDKWAGRRKVEGKNLAKEIPDPMERATFILRFSAMPGTSRHHWGTDIDLNSFTNAYFSSGQGLKEYQWLQEHAGTFGFCQVYSTLDSLSGRTTGYQEEKWHWSYLPVANRYLESYLAQISPDAILGFEGSEVARSLEVIRKYVGGINPDCLHDSSVKEGIE